MKHKTTFAIIAVVSLVAAAIISVVYLQMPAAGKYDKLAQCLTANGAIMYGTETCHVCVYQRELLGSSARYITEVDCVKQYDLCMRQQIGATPTWLINGSFVVGARTPEQLANESGCAI